MTLIRKSFILCIITIISIITLTKYEQVYSITTVPPESARSTISVVEFAKLSAPHNRNLAQYSSSSGTPNFIDNDTDDECLNGSIENKCDHVQERDLQSENILERRHVSTDDRAQLRLRLKEFDVLDQNKLFSYELLANNISDLNLSDELSSSELSTLKQVFILHRHGDRTPIQFPPKDPLKDEPFWEFHGYGQLTNRGKARVYLLGKIVRKRYDKFLGKSVNKNQRSTKSSGSLRCIESAQMFLASFLGLNSADGADAQELVWDKNNNPLAHLWQPASIQSVPAKFDGMLAESAECKILNEEYDIIDSSDFVKKISQDYKHEAEVMKEILGFEVDHFYKWFWGSSQIEVEREYFENKMDPSILSIYDRMQQAGNLGLNAFQSTKRLRRLRSGMLMNDIIINMLRFKELSHKINLNTFADTTIDRKKFIHYSAHDLTIVLLLGLLENWENFPFRPEYAANLVFELHRSEQDEWFVKIFYMPEVPSKYIELHVKNCESGHPKNRCTLEKLAQLMEPYMINSWQIWMNECKNDFHSIDPYLTGH